MRHLTVSILVTLAVLLGSAGCSSQVTSSSGRTIIVRSGFPDMGIENALLLAEKECLKKGKSARVQSVTSPNTDRYIFECVKN